MTFLRKLYCSTLELGIDFGCSILKLRETRIIYNTQLVIYYNSQFGINTQMIVVQ
jgi:hypothetical protein